MKKYALAVDAGGTKLQALLFDENMRVIRSAKAGGVNVNISTVEEVEKNMTCCLDILFPEKEDIRIWCVYYTFIGPFELFSRLLEMRFPVDRYQPVNEGTAGMLAGMLCPTGLCAMAGTGSDVYYAYREAGVSARGLDGVVYPPAVGGWGAVISDGGSGAWMGRKAMEMVEWMVEGIAPETPLLKEVQDELQAYGKEQLIRAIYSSPAPFRRLAQLTRAIGRAADAGDPHALDILCQAGEKMALQTCCQMKRHDIQPGEVKVVCSGGAWKTHAEMFRAFCRALQQLCPGQEVLKPRYEQVCAGIVLHGLEKGMTRAEIQAVMDESCADMLIQW